jgi:hypothetical protein
MATLYDYRAFGLNIASEFDIPGGVRFDLPVSNADIIIRSGDTSIGEAEATNGPYTRIGQALLFDAPGIARYYAPSPRQLYIEAYHGGDARQIGELLIATALPMLLWMRGGIVLHAAGIVPAGMDWAIAIAGPSGIGKSTLAAGLIETGAKLVGDDSLWLTLRGNKPVVSGLSVTLFKSGNSASPRTEIEIPAQSRIEGARLAAIIALRIAKILDQPPIGCMASMRLKRFCKIVIGPKFPPYWDWGPNFYRYACCIAVLYRYTNYPYQMERLRGRSNTLPP